MFASGGYFRSANCPFFKHGLCHRPYCHFRHSKPEYKPSPVTVPSETVAKPTTDCDSKKVEEEPEEYEKKLPEAKQEHVKKKEKNKSKKDEGKGAQRKEDEGKLSKTESKENVLQEKPQQQYSNPLFRRTALEEKLIANANNMDDMLSDSDNDSDRTEGPKQTKLDEHVSPQQGPNELSENRNTSEVETVGEVETAVTTNNDSKSDDTMAGEKSENAEHIPSEDINLDKVVEEPDDDTDKSSSKTPVIDNSLGELIDDLQKYGKGTDVESNTMKEKLNKNEVTEKHNEPNVEVPMLSDVSFFSPLVVKRKSRKNKVENSLSEKVVDKKIKTKKDKTDDIVKDKSAPDKVPNKVKEKKNKDIVKDKKTVKESLAAKKSSTKTKSKIQRYKELKKLINGSESCENKVQVDKPVIIPSCDDKAEKTSMTVTETKATEADDMIDDENDDELLRIFNDFNPCNESLSAASVELVQDPPCENHVISTSIKRPATEVTKVPIGFKKPRVAHQSSQLIQRSTGPVTGPPKTFRRLPRPLQGTLMPTAQTQLQETKPQGDRDILASTNVKKRVTHYTKGAGTLTSRPRIRLEFGAKVPQNIRQKYLDKLIDEYLLDYENPQEAFDRAEKEEKAIYVKSPRRQMYINLCVNLIKKLRDAEENNKDSDSEKRNPLAAKSLLPSPPKRVKVDYPTMNLSHSISQPETVDTQQTKAKNESGITEKNFYTMLQKYLLTEEELDSNGFPRPSEIPGHAEINESFGKLKKNPNDPTRHICCRCGKPFVILESGEYQTKEECVFHNGRLLRRRTAGELITSYTCCQGETGCIGCSVAKAHVRDIDWSGESNFVTTIPRKYGSTEKVFALDCEMCYTTKGLELTRVTVVDYNSEKVYDSLVKPDTVILDYNTRFSGITEESLIGVTTTLHDVQIVLLSLLTKDTILIGHSLESDLKALRIIHSSIVDTSAVFPHRLGLPYKRALRNLMGEYVRKIIQNNEEGHDSLEDAVSCIELMLWKVKEDMKMRDRKKKC